MSIKKFIILIGIILFSFCMICCKEQSSDDFITTQGSDFILHDKPFTFTGTNNYYMHYKDDQMIDDVIMQAKNMDLKVIRIWAFMDGVEGSAKGNNAFMQVTPGKYDLIPSGAVDCFERLDYTLKRAKEEELYVVLVLTNNWDAFGGMSQYVSWSDTAINHDDFYTDEQTKNFYKSYIHHLINRENIYTGVTYKNDPTIFSWELANEPRCESDPSGKTLVEWTDEMSRYVKSLDPNHLVALGDEGFFSFKNQENDWAYNGSTGVDWERLIKLEDLDYGTFHLYPEHWGESFTDDIESSTVKWIEDHARIAKNSNKPVVLEEYGIQKNSQYNRDYMYRLWTDAVEKNEVNGSMFWILTGVDTSEQADEQGMYPDYDGFRVLNDDSITKEILVNHALSMSGQKVEEKSAVFIQSPSVGEKISGVYAFKAKVINNKKIVKNISLNITGIDEPLKCSNKGVLVLETYNYKLDGEVTFQVVVEFEDGSIATSEVVAEVSNRKTEPYIIRSFTFDNSLEGFEQEASSQALFGERGTIHTNILGNGAVMIDTEWSGISDWQELRIVNRNIPEIKDTIRIEYDLYYQIDSDIQSGGVRPYAVGNPGWVKLGLDENNMNLKEMDIVTINGLTYAVQHVDIPVSNVSACNELYIGIVGSLMVYDGPIYLDNLVLHSERYID